MNILKMYVFGGSVAVLAIFIVYIKKFTTLVPEVGVPDLSEEVRDWFHRGKLYNVLGRNMFVVEEGTGPETIILIHGFPTSSFDYYRSISHLSQNYRVVTFDHIGFGFSDKPSENYTYSLVDQAEQALTLWRTLDIKSAYLVAHDMGDSILTEILARHERKMLPEHFDNFFKKIIFTNGGMIYDLINFRLSQRLLISPLGPHMASLGKVDQLAWISEVFIFKQLASLWSRAYTDSRQLNKDISDIQDINRYKAGNCLTHLTIGYLTDRARFERRWLNSLQRLEIPTLLLWGDDDAVAPVGIPALLLEHLNPEYTVYRTVQTGHFIMLEDPVLWRAEVINFIQQ